MLKLHNTLSGQLEEFKPIKNGEARVYNCGPTVYNYAHVGNLRAYVFTDILRRTLEWNGYKVGQVMNITDIGHLTGDADDGEDKMVKALRRDNKPFTLEAMNEVGTFYMEAFLRDLADLNIKLPGKMPRASNHITEDIEIIKILEEKGVAYKISDGVYYDISKYSDYGKLGGVNKSKQEAGVRVEVNPEKRNPADFNLWKFSADQKLGFPSPWGVGFPGWHIECSAMSRKYLGQPFDIHTGGVDHIGTHHNNEIAQSEKAFGVPLANYWLHNEHLNISGSKMAKSGDNFVTLSTLKAQSVSPMAFRYYLLGANYRTPMVFSLDAIKASSVALNNATNILAGIDTIGSTESTYIEKFTEVINDDLNTPKALAVFWELLNDTGVRVENKKATAFKMDEVLGLNLEMLVLDKEQAVVIPDQVAELIRKRNEARLAKDWAKADSMRQDIEKLGFRVNDSENGENVVSRI